MTSMAMAAAAVMRTLDGAPVPLEQVDISGTIDDALAQITVTQRYANRERQPIEAVYTFPLPPDAVLLDVEVTLGECRLRGCVVEQKQAEDDYETAIAEGNAAIMIERPAPDLFTMNLGNLLPGATAVVTFRYGLLLRYRQGELRFLHPTTVAPRYGLWRHEPHQEPHASLFVDNRATLKLSLMGQLASAAISSPSHAIVVSREPGQAVVGLKDSTLPMDRDFVLSLRPERVPSVSGWVGRAVDGGYSALLALCPRLPASAEPQPRDLKIVVDCSGSMQGDSIEQARRALERILALLRPQDRFALILFGSHQRVPTPAMLPGDDAAIDWAQREVLAGLDADLGGTELGAALNAAYRIPVRRGSNPTILLVTDGGVNDHEAIIRTARNSGHRFFTIGVGSAVAEGLVRGLAEVTAGDCELVAPREDMAERIVRLFRRIDAGAGASLEIQWPTAPIRTLGTESAVFSLDTTHIAAWFDREPEGAVTIRMTSPDGSITEEQAHLEHQQSAGEAPNDVARLAMSLRLGELPIELEQASNTVRSKLMTEAIAAAVAHQLLSPWTNWLLVAPQPGEPDQIPALRHVPQMVAAGWGGIGSAAAELRSTSIFACARTSLRLQEFVAEEFAAASGESVVARPQSPDWKASVLRAAVDSDRVPRLFDLVALLDVPDAVLDAIRHGISQGAEEESVIAALIWVLLKDRHAISELSPGERTRLRLLVGERREVSKTIFDSIWAALHPEHSGKA
jgi:Ca-activated chloride channel family protein